MPIHYSLFENYLTADPNDYIARVSPTRIAELEDVINRMIERGSTVTRADIVSVLEDFEKALQSLLSEGANVNLPFANYSAGIKGVFNGQTDTFDSSRHKMQINVQPGKSIKAYFATNAVCEKDETLLPQPNPIDFVDLSSGERNSIITPSSMGQVIGSKLKFNPDVAEEGIFFIATDNSETKVTIVGKNKPGELMFLVPALTSGEYHLAVRSGFGEEIREGRLKSTLSVA